MKFLVTQDGNRFYAVVQSVAYEKRYDVTEDVRKIVANEFEDLVQPYKEKIRDLEEKLEDFRAIERIINKNWYKVPREKRGCLL